MKLILGKETQYTKEGNLKNQVINGTYSGERELSDLLEEERYRTLGVCELECTRVIDGGKDNEQRRDEVNKMIKGAVKSKPKSEIEELREQNALLRQLIEKADTTKEVKEPEFPRSSFLGREENKEAEQVQEPDEETVQEWKEKYKEKFGRNPNKNWKLETIIEKINE